LTDTRASVILSTQTKKAKASASPPAFSEEVNIVFQRLPDRQSGVARMPCRYPRFVIFGGGALTIAKQVHQLNEDINDREVRLIGADGTQLGIMSSADALRIADEQGLDLVKISPQATPPVCRLMNYGKFRFEQSKKEKEARKNQHVVEIKEIRMSPGIDVGDFNTKVKSAQKFLSEGNRVKVSVRFRGREMAHTDIGRELLNRFAGECAESANLDRGANLEGRMMSIFLSPKTGK